VTLTIEDNGVGIDEKAPGERVGFGMDNLRKRVDDLGGTVELHSAAGAGTRIEVRVPIGEEA
jgi:signal transduction histidine kinase